MLPNGPTQVWEATDGLSHLSQDYISLFASPALGAKLEAHNGWSEQRHMEQYMLYKHNSLDNDEINLIQVSSNMGSTCVKETASRVQCDSKVISTILGLSQGLSLPGIKRLSSHTCTGRLQHLLLVNIAFPLQERLQFGCTLSHIRLWLLMLSNVSRRISVRERGIGGEGLGERDRGEGLGERDRGRRTGIVCAVRRGSD